MICWCISFILDEMIYEQNDQLFIQSSECNNVDKLTYYPDIANSCANARRRLQMQFHTRLKEKLFEYGSQLTSFIINHQPLKSWYLQLCTPILFVVYIAYRASYFKEQAKQVSQSFMIQIHL